MEISAGLLSRAMPEGDWTRQCEHRSIWRNGEGTMTERKR